LRALLLAAGLGSRLRPLTDFWPKCLMPIHGRPLLDYWLHTLQTLRVQQVLVNTHFHAACVKDFLDRDRFVNWVKAVYEEQLLGTAGTLRSNAAYFRGHTTFLIHADNWCQCDFSGFVDFHLNRRPSGCLITMMTFNSDTPETCGIVETDGEGRVVAFHEKVKNPPGRRANAAVYLLDREVIQWLEDHPDLTDFSTEVLPKFLGRISTWQNDRIHKDIGFLGALRAAQLDQPPAVLWPEDNWQKNFQGSFLYQRLMSYINIREVSHD
jgi:mannose-1-phosphate guanylyltransferase